MRIPIEGAAALHWLPVHPSGDAELKALRSAKGPGVAERIQALANSQLDFLGLQALDRILQKAFAHGDAPTVAPLRLALLGSATVEHLVPAIRVAGLRHGLDIQCHIGGYGQYRQEILNEASALYEFAPDVVLISIDHSAAVPTVPLTDTAAARHAIADRVREFRSLWRLARERLKATVIQQTVLDVADPLFGHLDSLVSATSISLIDELNRSFRQSAAEDGVLVLDLARWAARNGSRAWFDPVRWHQGKQEISPIQAPLYGDLVARQLAAIRGLSKKCLALDLDNTLWGGVIGDDGIEGLVLGQGNALGEAFQAFQHYVKRLSERGIIIVICSKNDDTVARAAFRDHPEMVLMPDDIAVFLANWDDKATNLQRIAATLNIDISAVAFFDDNPAERSIVRRTLPMVAVPEVPEDPALFTACLGDAGYFEATSFTDDDAKRTSQYVANNRREEVRAVAPDMASFLADLEMELIVGVCDRTNLSRIAQLINKTNQFNLTTRRYSEAKLALLMADPRAIGLWFRLKDRFGDNGLIAVAVSLPADDDPRAMVLDTWLMSCRVLGRCVEEAMLAVLVEEARKKGASRLIGEYIPSSKNSMVRDHYRKLGFKSAGDMDGISRWVLPLDGYKGKRPIMAVTRTQPGA